MQAGCHSVKAVSAEVSVLIALKIKRIIILFYQLYRQDEFRGQGMHLLHKNAINFKGSRTFLTGYPVHSCN